MLPIHLIESYFSLYLYYIPKAHLKGLYFCVRYQNKCTMGFFFIIDYLVSFFVLIAIHAPWWAWLIYIGSALLWFVVWVLIDGGTNEKTANSHKNESQ